MGSLNALQHNDFRHISSMNNRGDFNREKISDLGLLHKKQSVDRLEYGGKDTGRRKTIKNYRGASRTLAKILRFSPGL
jgi:hypothetical protein